MYVPDGFVHRMFGLDLDAEVVFVMEPFWQGHILLRW